MYFYFANNYTRIRHLVTGVRSSDSLRIPEGFVKIKPPHPLSDHSDRRKSKVARNLDKKLDKEHNASLSVEMISTSSQLLQM
jgi:hypothetical protein